MLFLANENFPFGSIKILRDAKYDVLAISEYQAGMHDKEVLRLAHVQKRIILTFDRDYGELIYKYKEVTPIGIVFFRFIPLNPKEPGLFLLRVLQEKIVLENKFTVFEHARIRQNSLLKEPLAA